MTPHEFIRKWRGTELKERSASQSHFNDLCALLDEPDPISADKTGEWFTFEKGASKTSGGNGWADVWRKECFAWEYKGPKKDLDAAFRQLLNYSIALDNPPLLIVSDMDVIRIHTNWTNTVEHRYEITLDDLLDAGKRDLLKAAFTNPERLKPAKTRQMLTEETAQGFAGLALRLRQRGHDPEKVAHFVNRLVFCMFAEDVGLLPNKMFQRMVEQCQRTPEDFVVHASTLFAAMKGGGRVGFETVEWFNGGLFDTDDALPLDKQDVKDLLTTAKLVWSDIDPSIFGTLFERGLDPDKRSQLGAHYTDREKIMLIINPVIVEPLTAEWEEIKEQITAKIEAAPRETPQRLLRGNELGLRTRAFNDAQRLMDAFLTKLRKFRVLDPACGSGNFLYLSLLALKDLEHRVNLQGFEMGLLRRSPAVGPECVMGIEINPYAAELARVSVWIGEIQWMRRNGFDAARNPILRPLDTIECRDAILNPDKTEAEWPRADVVIGNPPFLGAKLMKRVLGVDQTNSIRSVFKDRLPGFTDFVCYWFEKAREYILSGQTLRAGLVATDSIAKNTNLPVMRRITESMEIYRAYSSKPWVIDGASLQVAIVCFSKKMEGSERILNEIIVEKINPNLTTGVNVSASVSLKENRNTSFLGVQKSGPFDISGEMARNWLVFPKNINGNSNSNVLKPYWNGDDLTSRPRDIWIIDIPLRLNESQASCYEAPFQYLLSARYDSDDPKSKTLKEERQTARDNHARDRWWEHYWPRPEMRSKIERLSRYVVVAETAQHRIFIWLRHPIVPDKNLIVFARDDDTFFGVIHSKIHRVWSLSIGSALSDRPRYTSSTTFETFPFPEGLMPNIPAADYADDPHAQRIAAAAARLNTLRENWLNPPDLVKRVPEVVPGYPDRILPVDDKAAAILKKRTLTNLYNQRPAWLDHAHAELDEAVAEAYGWGDDWRAGKLDEDEILSRLFHLNQERAAAQG